MVFEINLRFVTVILALLSLTSPASAEKPEMPQKDLDFVEIGWGGTITGPVKSATWRIYSDDMIYYFEEGWDKDVLIYDIIAGSFNSAIDIVNGRNGTDIIKLKKMEADNDCYTLDYGHDRVVMRIAGAIIKVENHCPHYLENLNEYGRAFFTLWNPLKEMANIDPR